MTNSIQELSVVLDTVGALIAAVSDAQWNWPTPCIDWNVRDLVHHIVNGNETFTNALGGLALKPNEPSMGTDTELSSRYQDSASMLLAAFRRPGVKERVVTIPFGSVPGEVALHLRIAEILVHGWDLGRATERVVSFPDDIVENEEAFSRLLLPQIPPDRYPFAPPKTAPAGSSPIDRLSALLGRTVEA